MYSYFETQGFWKTIATYIIGSILGLVSCLILLVAFVPSFQSTIMHISNFSDIAPYITLFLLAPNLFLCLWYFIRSQQTHNSIRKDIASISHSGFRIYDGLMILFFNLIFSIVTIMIFSYISSLFPAGISPTTSQDTGAIVDSLIITLLITFSTAIVGPIAEEFVFRGALFTGLIGRVGFYPSMLVSSFLFMMIHSSIQYVGAFVFGIMMVYVYHKTRNIFIPILIHIANNMIPSLFSIHGAFFPKESHDFDAAISALSYTQGFLIATPFMIIGCVFLFILIKKRGFLKYNQSFAVSQ